MKSLLARSVLQDQLRECFFAFQLWVQLVSLNITHFLDHIKNVVNDEGGVDVSVAAQLDTVLWQPNYFTFRRKCPIANVAWIIRIFDAYVSEGRRIMMNLVADVSDED